MPASLWSVVLVLIFSCRLRCEEDPTVPAIAKRFTTKGRYEEVNPHLIHDLLAVDGSVAQPPAAHCRGLHLTAIVRHGTRYPSAKNVRKMQDLYRLVRSGAPGADGWLRELQDRWVMWYTEEMDGRLARKGQRDHESLAVRLSKLFPSMVNEENLRAGLVTFATSSKHRCVNSTLSFKAGLAELWSISDMEIEHTVNDALMRFFDQCTRFVQEVESNPSALSEVEKFKQGPEVRRVREKIADRLRVPYSNITYDSAEAAFYLCAYEFAIKTVNSPWCRLFDQADAQIMEYANDLKQFWKRGYGHDINKKSSCVLFHDLFNRLERAAEDHKSGREVTEAVTVQVGHAETLLPLLTLLGFFKDNRTLTSTNFAEMTERSFRTSLMMPYAANLVLVLYDCGDGDLRLQAMLNEKPAVFPGLSGPEVSAPRFQDVKELYRELLQGCDFESECQLFEAPAGG